MDLINDLRNAKERSIQRSVEGATDGDIIEIEMVTYGPSTLPRNELILDASDYEIDEDEQCYINALYLLNDVHEFCLEFEEVKLSKTYRQKLLDMKKRVTDFMMEKV